jgi:Malectin domain
VIKDIDILSTVGKNKKLTKVATVDVMDGSLSIKFLAKVENPTISGIEIKNAPSDAPVGTPMAPVAPPAIAPVAPPAIAPVAPPVVNTFPFYISAAAAYNGTKFWVVDTPYVVGPSTPSLPGPTLDIANTTEDGLYSKERYGGNGWSYQIPITNGVYKVVMHFAEL